MPKYSIGLDFGTNSVRSVIVNINDGEEVATYVYDYPSGENGVIIDSKNPELARQNPDDYLKGIEVTIKESLKIAKENDKNFKNEDVIGIGVDTTGSSPMPVDEDGTPLCYYEKFKNNPNAYVWLWKDHTSHREAGYITETARKYRPQYLAKIGGVYSSEWFWSKILHCKNIDPEVFDAAYSWVEICDWIPANLVGDTKPGNIKRSVCAAGHKAMYNKEWGGLPDKEFLKILSPGLEKLRDNLYEEACTSNNRIGNLSGYWVEKLGLSENVTVAVGAFDAHMGAVGAGIKEETLVKIIGTSTCDIMIYPKNRELADIPGVCGIVDGSVIERYYGIEAGQSGVGDIFLWFVNNLVPESYGSTTAEKFKTLSMMAEKIKPGESGLLALDWNNGNRTILVDARLTGLLVGQTLHTKPHEIYRALIEATGFGALRIIDRLEEYGVGVKDVINCGGLAFKNPLLMQIYADIIGRPMKVTRSEQTCALGAAIFGAVAAGSEAGGYDSVFEAQSKMSGTSKVYHPDVDNNKVYKRLYKLYCQLHDAFGTKEFEGNLYSIMKELLEIRDSIRKVNDA